VGIRMDTNMFDGYILNEKENMCHCCWEKAPDSFQTPLARRTHHMVPCLCLPTMYIIIDTLHVTQVHTIAQST
jgi:hypothetical protein